MNSLQQRLAALTDTTANLKAQLCELNELRERVEKELLSARKSPPSSSGASRSNNANTISDGVHASIAPKQIACKVVMTPPWDSRPLKQRFTL
jgi:hypothetical protein